MKAIIKSKHFITEGGCNACQAFELETFTMHLENGKEERIVCQKKACDQELFTEANAVLQQLFAMEPVEFVIEQA